MLHMCTLCMRKCFNDHKSTSVLTRPLDRNGCEAICVKADVRIVSRRVSVNIPPLNHNIDLIASC